MSSDSGNSLLQSVLAKLRQESELRISELAAKFPDPTGASALLQADLSYRKGVAQGHLDGILACTKAIADALAINTLQGSEPMQKNGVSGRMPSQPHPHPRSRIYRSEPLSWQIIDSNPSHIQQMVLLKAKASSRKPLVIFDLDGTLFDVGYRTLGILKTWLASNEAKKFDARVLNHVAQIEFNHIGYSLAHAFENAGLDLREQEVVDVFTAAEKNWRRKFFDGQALVEYDAVMPGAEKFVRTFLNAGIEIAYLTGRHQTAMLEGTKAQLEKFHFPVQGCRLILKTNFGQDDHEFKAEAFRHLASSHEVVGNFENEYINIASMSDSKPDCIHVIVDTQHSGRPVPSLEHPVYRIDNFEK